MRHLLTLFGALTLCAATRAGAQSVLERTPNLDRGWTGETRTAYLTYTHRFGDGSTPTFLLAYAPPFENTLFGVKYAAHSSVAPGSEWELLVRESFGSSVALAAAYNTGAESIDTEANLSHNFGAFSMLAVGRWFTSDANGDRFAVGGGAVFRLTPMFALAGDVMTLLNRNAGEKAAWGGALQIAIPRTRHTLSLQVTNTGSATMEGSSRGGGTRYGFEFTVPIRTGKPPVVAAKQEIPSGATRVVIANNEFQPKTITVARGTTIAWQNTDLLPHTVTSADKKWTSQLLQQGDVYVRTFDQPGHYEITCNPHPYMKMIVDVGI